MNKSTAFITKFGENPKFIVFMAHSGVFGTPKYPMYDVFMLTPWQFYNVTGVVTTSLLSLQSWAQLEILS